MVGMLKCFTIFVEMAKVVLPQSSRQRAGISWVVALFFHMRKKRYMGRWPCIVSGIVLGFLANARVSVSRALFIVAKGHSESSSYIVCFLQALFTLTCLHVSMFPSPQSVSALLDRFLPSFLKLSLPCQSVPTLTFAFSLAFRLPWEPLHMSCSPSS